MKLKQLIEEFKTGVKVRGVYYEIFVNPTTKELKELDIARFIIDYKKKVLYAFKFGLLHQYVAEELNIPYPEGEGYFFGEGDTAMGRFEDWTSSPLRENDKVKKQAWLRKYIGVPAK